MSQYQPGVQPGPPPGGSSGNTLLVVLAIIGGVIFLVVAFCGFSAYMFVSGVKKQVTEIGDAIKEEVEKEREDRADQYVLEYQTHQKVVEKIGAITSHELRKTKSTFSTGPMRIDVTGKQGSGVLVITQPKMEGDKFISRAFLEVDGEKILIDDNVDGYGFETSEEVETEPIAVPDSETDSPENDDEKQDVPPVSGDPIENAATETGRGK